MPQKVRIALDAMGGDVGASVVIPGAANSLSRHPGSEFLLFAPADEIAPQIDADDDDGENAMAEPPEPIENGMIDLGRLAADVLHLAIDPYPRKQGVVFEAEVVAPDPEDHPFAALKALQTAPEKPEPSPGKTKGK